MVEKMRAALVKKYGPPSVLSVMDVETPVELSNAIFTLFEIIEGNVIFSISNPNEEANFIFSWNIQEDLDLEQLRCVQIPAYRIITAIHSAENVVYIATSMIEDGLPISIVYTIDADLNENSLEMFENGVKGEIVEICTFISHVGLILVFGVSKGAYRKDDELLF